MQRIEPTKSSIWLSSTDVSGPLLGCRFGKHTRRMATAVHAKADLRAIRIPSKCSRGRFCTGDLTAYMTCIHNYFQVMSSLRIENDRFGGSFMSMIKVSISRSSNDQSDQIYGELMSSRKDTILEPGPSRIPYTQQVTIIVSYTGVVVQRPDVTSKWP
ncbi:hypothetical protein BJ508DRAFT_125254 [Ascobolus immersus RN42]|uniref:Uncharacterized protein n=1 Tax=Ascobolus immersus RN42 TaxID=1160509 RepID=A0A3N4I977_ASCIM|nr:hypothetical protein BJ508DRAFT_125254 [Ascobolus immersus RN42]